MERGARPAARPTTTKVGTAATATSHGATAHQEATPAARRRTPSDAPRTEPAASRPSGGTARSTAASSRDQRRSTIIAANSRGRRVRTTWKRPPSHRRRCTCAARPRPTTGAREPGVTGVDGPHPGEPEVDRVLEVLGAREGVPGMVRQHLAAEQHAVAHQVARQPEDGATPEPHPVEEQEGGSPQLGPGRPVLVATPRYSACTTGAPRSRRATSAPSRPGSATESASTTARRGEVGVALEQPVHRPAQRRALAAGIGGGPHQHRRPGRRGACRRVVRAVVGDHHDVVQICRVRLLPERGDASAYESRLVVGRAPARRSGCEVVAPPRRLGVRTRRTPARPGRARHRP